jgi:hypothetical protein
MRSKIGLLAMAGMYLGCATLGQAQEATMKPPKILTITREVVKTGKASAHEKWEEGFPKAYAKAKWPQHYLAMTAITGESRVLFLTPYESMAAWEADVVGQDKNAELSAANESLGSKDGEFLSESKTAVFTYMPELSYQPEGPIAGVRGFMVVAQTVKPGHGKHYEELRKMIKAAHEKAALKEHYSVYHVSAGAPSGLYLIFIPIKGLAEVDQFDALHGQTYKDALGEEGQNKITEFGKEGMESSETQLFVFSPKMSYMPKEWVDADPDFWAPKPAAAAKPAAAKKDAKP